VVTGLLQWAAQAAQELPQVFLGHPSPIAGVVVLVETLLVLEVLAAAALEHLEIIMVHREHPTLAVAAVEQETTPLLQLLATVALA
jgi:hypothetical protein